MVGLVTVPVAVVEVTEDDVVTVGAVTVVPDEDVVVLPLDVVPEDEDPEEDEPRPRDERSLVKMLPEELLDELLPRKLARPPPNVFEIPLSPDVVSPVV